MRFQEPTVRTRTRGPAPADAGLGTVMVDSAGRRYRLTGYDPARAAYIFTPERGRSELRLARVPGAGVPVWADACGMIYRRAER